MGDIAGGRGRLTWREALAVDVARLAAAAIQNLPRAAPLAAPQRPLVRDEGGPGSLWSRGHRSRSVWA
jgi:hypothetical protein